MICTMLGHVNTLNDDVIIKYIVIFVYHTNHMNLKLIQSYHDAGFHLFIKILFNRIIYYTHFCFKPKKNLNSNHRAIAICQLLFIKAIHLFEPSISR